MFIQGTISPQGTFGRLRLMEKYIGHRLVTRLELDNTYDFMDGKDLSISSANSLLTDLNCSGDVSAGLQQDPDAPNNLLISIFLQQLATLHDREIPLSNEDSEGLLEQLLLRSRPENAPPLSFIRSESSPGQSSLRKIIILSQFTNHSLVRV